MNDYSLSDFAALMGGNNGFGGGNGAIWIVILFLFLCGRGGWNNNGNGGGESAGMQRGFDQSTVVTKLDGITQGICDLGFNTINAVNSGFSAAELARCNQTTTLLQMLNQMQSSAKDCCCETQRLIERSFCDLGGLVRDSTKGIMEKLGQMEYNSLNDKYQAALAENQGLKSQINITGQNGYLEAVVNSAVARILNNSCNPCCNN